MNTKRKFASERDVELARRTIAADLATMEQAGCTMMQMRNGFSITGRVYFSVVTLESINNRSNPRSGVVTDMKQTMWKVNGKRTAGRAVEQAIINHYLTI